MFVMAMEQMNAARGLENPGVLKNFTTDSRNGGSLRLDVRLFHSDVDGAISGSSWNCNIVPKNKTVEQIDMRPK